MVGHYRHASETPLQWRFAGGSMMATFKWHLDPLSISSTKKTHKNSVLYPLWQNILDLRMSSVLSSLANVKTYSSSTFYKTYSENT